MLRRWFRDRENRRCVPPKDPLWQFDERLDYLTELTELLLLEVDPSGDLIRLAMERAGILTPSETTTCDGPTSPST
jgi:hypothetical protein